QSSGHSAHIGEEVEIHYRWHAFYGRQVRRYYGERRSGSEVVVVEHEPGVTTAVERWMLDRATCAAMTLGEPQVSVEALMDLDRVLKDRGLRQVFSDDTTVIEEACDESTTAPRHRKATLPAQHDVGNTRVDANEHCGATGNGSAPRAIDPAGGWDENHGGGR
ncbi:hypothetical protein, partial [Rhizobium sp. RHZ01]|uniref:hypothetical protein n=1 Tax=Rhizobium sp. RHZ01 TaxID=2769304 RepID=UPI001AEDFCFA